MVRLISHTQMMHISPKCLPRRSCSLMPHNLPCNILKGGTGLYCASSGECMSIRVESMKLIRGYYIAALDQLMIERQQFWLQDLFWEVGWDYIVWQVFSHLCSGILSPRGDDLFQFVQLLFLFLGHTAGIRRVSSRFDTKKLTTFRWIFSVESLRRRVLVIINP